MSCAEEIFHLADIYRTTEMEAYDILGQTIVLVRCAFSPALKYAHLVPDREIPHKTYTLEEALQKIRVEKFRPNTPIHFINDEPFLTARHLISELLSDGERIHVNTNGVFHIGEAYLTNSGLVLYLITRPNLYLHPRQVEKAIEVRTYWKPGDPVYGDHFHELLDLLEGLNMVWKMVLVPHSPDTETIHQTMKVAMDYGVRIGLHPASLLPDVDKPFQNNPESEEVIHAEQRRILKKK